MINILLVMPNEAFSTPKKNGHSVVIDNSMFKKLVIKKE